MGKHLPIALRYHGGKSKIAEWIISHFPNHLVYAELFGGGASVLINKTPVKTEIYNDLNDEIVNFFSVLRSKHSEKLLSMIELTPYSRYEFNLSYELSDDIIEQARRTAVRSMMSFGGNGMSNSKTGFRATANNRTSAAGRFDRYSKELKFIIDRFKNITIECRNAIELIKVHDSEDTLCYLDPPYLMGTRKCTNRLYKHEMDDEEHRELAKVIHKSKAMFIISGYPSKLYDELYADFQKVEKTSMANSQRGGVPTVEVIWLSPNIKQQSLF